MLRNFIITLPFLLMCNPTFSDTPESGGYWQCMIEPLPDLLFKPQVRRLTIGALDCFDIDRLETVAGIVASQQNRQNAVCRAYASLTESCRDYLAHCENDDTACKAALENVIVCRPYLSEANTLLKSVGVNTAENLGTNPNFVIKGRNMWRKNHHFGGIDSVMITTSAPFPSMNSTNITMKLRPPGNGPNYCADMRWLNPPRTVGSG
ncbi:MAG: hypothetical protein DRR19_13740 [Candidatus Parabeggiatoa sp. nov. 1]|nr:MAG: hypothetical protein DRR19_13740 [Gammaproteobacteria bacterium]